MTNDLIIYGENICAFPHILGIPSYIWLCNRSHLNFLIYEENFIWFFISARTLTPLAAPAPSICKCFDSLLGNWANRLQLPSILKYVFLLLPMTPMTSMAVCQLPMLPTRWGKGRWKMKQSLKASLRTSMRLLRRAQRPASGYAELNRVTYPNYRGQQELKI